MNIENPTPEQEDTLRSFLKEEIDEIKMRLDQLRGKIKEADYRSLEGELNERGETLESLKDDDDSQLFLLRRKIGMLKESLEAMAVKRSWWSRVPAAFWVAIATLVVLLYFVWLAVLQWRGSNQGLIYDYPATQTAVAAQATAVSIPTITPTPIPTVTQ